MNGKIRVCKGRRKEFAGLMDPSRGVAWEAAAR